MYTIQYSKLTANQFHSGQFHNVVCNALAQATGFISVIMGSMQLCALGAVRAVIAAGSALQ